MRPRKRRVVVCWYQYTLAMTTTGFSDWVQDRAAEKGATSDAEIARLLGLVQSTVSRWARGSEPTGTATLRKIATGLGVPMREVLMRAGYLTESEADLREVTVPASPSTVTNDQLLGELRQRLDSADKEKVRPRSRGTRGSSPRGRTVADLATRSDPSGDAVEDAQ